MPSPNLAAAVLATAEEHPDAPAVRHGDQVLSYRELTEVITRVAGRVAALDLDPGTPVGVLVGRGVELPGVLLGIMAAGQLPVLLDPAYPRGDLELLLAEAAAVVVGDYDEAEQVPEHDIVCLAEDGPVSELPALAGGQDPACVLHTAIQCQQVVLSHGVLLERLAAVAETLELGPGDRVAALAPLSLGVAALELFLPLTVGAELVLAASSDLADVESLRAFVERSEPTLMHATPTCWHALLVSGWAGAPRLIALCGGEPLPATLAAQLVELTGAVWQSYGPVEAGVCATLHRVRADEPGPTVPLSESGLRVLDAQLRPIQDGEVYVSGGLASEYLGRPDLTAERFVADPFSPGTRLFRTGDLGRRLPDGGIEFAGRAADHLDGVRFAEVERALLAVGGLTRCVVLPGDPGLTAHLVAEPGWPIDPAELRAATADFGVAVEPMPHQYLPMAPDGRVDRLDLAGRQPARSAQTPEERVIAQAWTELLDLPDPPAEVSFFELGGHSMAVIQLAMRLQRAFSLDIPVPDLFDNPTIAGQAELVERLYQQQLAEFL